MGITGEWGRRLFAPWNGLPVRSRVLLAGYALGFLEGAGAHIQQMSGGGLHTYDGFPAATQALFYTLVAWDALAVALAVRALAAVVPLGVAIMAADLTANWWSNGPAVAADPGILWSPVGLLPMTLFGVFVVSAAFPLWRTLRSRPSPLAAPQIS